MGTRQNVQIWIPIFLVYHVLKHDFYIKARIAFLSLKFFKARQLPNDIPDKEEYLSLVPYSSLIPTIIPVNTTLVKPIPKDEIDTFAKNAILKINAFLSKRTTNLFDFSKSLHSPEECKIAFHDAIGKHIDGLVPQPSFESSLLDPNHCLLQSSFYDNLVPECDFYVIDSLYMTKYKYKPGLLAPAVKAYFTFQNKTLVLQMIQYNGAFYKKGSAEFDLGRRLLYNYLLIDTVVNKHLIVSHLKINQTGAYAIRKFMSKSNTLKQFLYNFSYGVNPINHATDLLIGKDYGNVIKFFPFTEESLLHYINDRIADNHESTCFPKNPV